MLTFETHYRDHQVETDRQKANPKNNEAKFSIKKKCLMMKLKNKIFFLKKSNEKNPSQPVIKITSYKKNKKKAQRPI